MLCCTPAQGHTAPLLALARVLVAGGHDVMCFTTEHYRERVLEAGAAFSVFAPEYDAHDLMVANPDRESGGARGVRGVKDDLRRIFIGPLVGQYVDLVRILEHFDAEVIVTDTMFFGALPLALGPRSVRPALATVGVMPLAQSSRDTAPFGAAYAPGSGAPYRLRNEVMNWVSEHVVMRDIQRLAQRCLAQCGAPAFSGYFIDLVPKVVDAYFQACVAEFEYPRSDLPASIRFVGPIVATPTRPSGSGDSRPAWWGELDAGAPVVHVTQGTLDNADLGRLLIPAANALAQDDVLVVATTGGPDPEPVRAACAANVLVERFIPHDLLLPHVSAMVTNGGYGGVQQALAHGVPLVVAGDSEDKPEVAARVAWSGAGIDLRTGRPSGRAVVRAVRQVLSDPTYRARSESLAAAIAATDATSTIAASVLELAERSAR